VWRPRRFEPKPPESTPRCVASFLYSIRWFSYHTLTGGQGRPNTATLRHQGASNLMLD
jgi:hypothetical protein